MVQETTLFSRLDMSVAAGQRPVMMGVWLLAINVLLSTAMLKVLKSSSQFLWVEWSKLSPTRG